MTGNTTIRHIVNGETVISYEKPQIGGWVVNNSDPKAKPDGELLSRGWISLQSESHSIEFRKVELLNLEGCMDPKATNYKTYFVKADNSRCQIECGSSHRPSPRISFKQLTRFDLQSLFLLSSRSVSVSSKRREDHRFAYLLRQSVFNSDKSPDL